MPKLYPLLALCLMLLPVLGIAQENAKLDLALIPPVIGFNWTFDTESDFQQAESKKTTSFVYQPQPGTVIRFPQQQGIPFASDQLLIFNGKRTKSYSFYRPNGRNTLSTNSGWVLQSFINKQLR